MRLVLRNIKKSDEDEMIAEGDTGLGIIFGLWRSRHFPAVGEDYDVELTLPDPVAIRILSASKAHVAGVETLDLEHFLFRGVCEVIYDDGAIALRIATNWGEMVSAKNFTCKKGDWIEFTVRRDQVEIYPIGG